MDKLYLQYFNSQIRPVLIRHSVPDDAIETFRSVGEVIYLAGATQGIKIAREEIARANN